MMGPTHMLGGATAWLGACALTTPTPRTVVLGTGLAVAGALAPDVDHRNADAAQFARTAGSAAVLFAAAALRLHTLPGVPWPLVITAGVLVAALPWLTRPHTGGHFRGVVHSVWGAAAITALTVAPALAWPHAWPWWAAAAVLAGWASHLALDALTKEGLPLAWPAPIRFGWLPREASMTTGGRRRKRGRRTSWWRHARRTGPEYWAVQPLLVILAVTFAYLTVRPGR